MDPDDVVARIFVGGLDHDCDEGDLVKAFSMFGEISQVMIMKDHETNQSRGFGFISFQEQDSADDAIRRMHGVEIMGRCVTVRKAEKQGNMGDRPRRGGFRGSRGGGDRYGGRSDSRYESRGRGSYSSGRRESNDGYQGGYRGRGRTYGDSRRGGFDSSRLGSGRDNYSAKRGGYDGSRSGRPGGYNNRRQDNDPEDVGSRYTDDRYSTSRKTYGDDRYVDSRRDDSSRGYGGPSASRDGYNSSRYETSARGRSRSPIGRTIYRDESPVPAKTYRGDTYRDFSPGGIQRTSTRIREYSPVAESRGGYGESNFRDFSPPASRGRARDVSPDFAPMRGRGRVESPSRDRPSSYRGSRSGGFNKSPPIRRSEYSSTRSQEFPSREGRYDSGRGGRQANGQDRGGPGSRSSYAGHSDAPPSRTSRYVSNRHGGSPPVSRTAPREFVPRGIKQRESGSPIERRSGRRI